jgi:hypothetical protein
MQRFSDIPSIRVANLLSNRSSTLKTTKVSKWPMAFKYHNCRKALKLHTCEVSGSEPLLTVKIIISFQFERMLEGKLKIYGDIKCTCFYLED